jgi:hypothetical protein
MNLSISNEQSERTILPTGTTPISSAMNDDRGSTEFDEAMLVEQAEQGGFVPVEQRQQFVVVDVARRDQQQLGRAFIKFEAQLKIGTLVINVRSSLLAWASKAGSGVRLLADNSSVLTTS